MVNHLNYPRSTSLWNLNPRQIAMLVTLATHQPFGAYAAQAILEQYYGYQFPILIDQLDGSITQRAKSTEDKFSTDAINDLQLYPNPSSDKITLFYAIAFGQNLTIEIYNPEGKMLLSKNLNSHRNSWEIDVSSLKSSAYHIILKNGQKILSSTNFIKY